MPYSIGVPLPKQDDDQPTMLFEKIVRFVSYDKVAHVHILKILGVSNTYGRTFLDASVGDVSRTAITLSGLLDAVPLGFLGERALSSVLLYHKQHVSVLLNDDDAVALLRWALNEAVDVVTFVLVAASEYTSLS